MYPTDYSPASNTVSPAILNMDTGNHEKVRASSSFSTRCDDEAHCGLSPEYIALRRGYFSLISHLEEDNGSEHSVEVDNPRNSARLVEGNPSAETFEDAQLKRLDEKRSYYGLLKEDKASDGLAKEKKELGAKCQKQFDATSIFSPIISKLFKEVMVQTIEQIELENKKQRREREIAEVHGRTLHLLEQLPEIVKVNRNVIWKISLFSRKMTNAQTETEVVVCSPPFYIEELHYRVYLQLYPNGKGAGKGSHMSLFLVIMRGEFDEDLEWPFAPKITFKLIDQTGDKDIVHIFQPNPIKKPTFDRSDGCGYIHFVSHADLKSEGFVEDDTLLIQCEMHPAN